MNLFAFGWTHVRIHILVLGHTGVMRQDFVKSLIQLGVSPCTVTPFLSALAISGLHRSCGFLASFPSMRDATSDPQSSGHASHMPTNHAPVTSVPLLSPLAQQPALLADPSLLAFAHALPANDADCRNLGLMSPLIRPCIRQHPPCCLQEFLALSQFRPLPHPLLTIFLALLLRLSLSASLLLSQLP